MSEERSSGAAGGERRRGGGRRGRRASDDDEEESGEDLLGDNMMDDYKDMGRLDAYDDENLDARDYEAMGFAERQEAERQMRERDLREGKRGRDAALHSDTGGALSGAAVGGGWSRVSPLVVVVRPHGGGQCVPARLVSRPRSAFVPRPYPTAPCRGRERGRRLPRDAAPAPAEGAVRHGRGGGGGGERR